MSGPALSGVRVAHHKRSRINPIRQLQPETLSRQLDAFTYGHLREAALIWEAIERRDDVLMSVAAKRKKAPARRSWEILTSEESPQAEAHKATLEHFYNNLRATHALDRNVSGGVGLLVRQMMDAVGKMYAVHNIVWRQNADGLTADLHFVPLWFFENTTGRLRFLESDTALEGRDLEPGAWMVTLGDGLMEACSIAYLFKKMPMEDWLIYSGRHGMPGIQGKTRAAQDSEEWKSMEDAVERFSAEFSCVTSDDESIEKIDLSASGELPYPKLVERMDRAMAAMWRGADLSTMSAGSGEGTGASIQGDEMDLLEIDDCAMISETLNEQIDRWVIRLAHGDETPLAYFNISRPQNQDTRHEIEIDRLLLDAGVELGEADTLERYGRAAPAPGEAVIKKSAEFGMRSAEFGFGRAPNERTGKARLALLDSALLELSRANAALGREFADLLELDGDAFASALQDFSARASTLLPDPALEQAWENLLTAASLNGLTQ